MCLTKTMLNVCYNVCTCSSCSRHKIQLKALDLMVLHSLAGTAKQQCNRSPESNLPPFNMFKLGLTSPLLQISIVLYANTSFLVFQACSTHISVKKYTQKTCVHYKAKRHQRQWLMFF